MCVLVFGFILVIIVISETDKVNPTNMERSNDYVKEFRR